MRSDNLLLTGSGDSTCAIWDVESGQVSLAGLFLLFGLITGPEVVLKKTGALMRKGKEGCGFLWNLLSCGAALRKQSIITINLTTTALEVSSGLS